MELGPSDWLLYAVEVEEGGWAGSAETQETWSWANPAETQGTGAGQDQRRHRGLTSGDGRLLLQFFITVCRGQLQLTLSGESVGGAPFHPLELHKDTHWHR